MLCGRMNYLHGGAHPGPSLTSSDTSHCFVVIHVDFAKWHATTSTIGMDRPCIVKSMASHPNSFDLCGMPLVSIVLGGAISMQTK